MTQFRVCATATVPVDIFVDAEDLSGAQKKAYKILRQMPHHSPGLLATPAGGAWIKWPRVDGIMWGETTVYVREQEIED
jgi:hypothetical protein